MTFDDALHAETAKRSFLVSLTRAEIVPGGVPRLVHPRVIPHGFVRARNSRLSFLRGAPLFLAIAFLSTVPLYSRTLGALAVGALFALWLLTLTSVKRVGGS